MIIMARQAGAYILEFFLVYSALGLFVAVVDVIYVYFRQTLAADTSILP
jgi:hypothetical protein